MSCPSFAKSIYPLYFITSGRKNNTGATQCGCINFDKRGYIIASSRETKQNASLSLFSLLLFFRLLPTFACPLSFACFSRGSPIFLHTRLPRVFVFFWYKNQNLQQVWRGFRRGTAPGLNRNLGGGVHASDEVRRAPPPLHLAPEAEQRSGKLVLRWIGEAPGRGVVARGSPRRRCLRAYLRSGCVRVVVLLSAVRLLVLFPPPHPPLFSVFLEGGGFPQFLLLFFFILGYLVFALGGVRRYGDRVACILPDIILCLFVRGT